MRYEKPIAARREQVRFQSTTRTTEQGSGPRLAACLWCRHEYVATDGFGVFCSRTCALEEARS